MKLIISAADRIEIKKKYLQTLIIDGEFKILW